MKLHFNILITAFVLCTTFVKAQTKYHKAIDITFNKTTSIIFPYRIKSVDRGSRDILAQKAGAVENVLQVKAGQRHFPETNLTVITSDGTVHQYDVRYSEEPLEMKLRIQPSTIEDVSGNGIQFSDGINDDRLSEISEHILAASPRTVKSYKKFQVKLSIQGIHTDGNLIFCRVHIQNGSNIDYDVDAIRIFIRDQQRVKRTATQEVELYPVFTSRELTAVPARSSRQVVYGLSKVPIPDSKVLELRLAEKNGGRNLKVKLSNTMLMKAKSINSK